MVGETEETWVMFFPVVWGDFSVVVVKKPGFGEFSGVNETIVPTSKIVWGVITGFRRDAVGVDKVKWEEFKFCFGEVSVVVRGHTGRGGRALSRWEVDQAVSTQEEVTE